MAAEVLQPVPDPCPELGGVVQFPGAPQAGDPGRSPSALARPLLTQGRAFYPPGAVREFAALADELLELKAIPRDPAARSS